MKRGEVNPNSKMQIARRLMEAGMGLREAARAAGVDAGNLSRAGLYAERKAAGCCTHCGRKKPAKKTKGK